MRKFVSLINKNFGISFDKYPCTIFFPEISFHANFHNQKIEKLCREVENVIDGRASCRTPLIVVDGKRIRGFFSTPPFHAFYPFISHTFPTCTYTCVYFEPLLLVSIPRSARRGTNAASETHTSARFEVRLRVARGKVNPFDLART